MIIAVLMVLGLAFGSFINAFIWRFRQQELVGQKSKTKAQKYSILHGRSMCPNCGHTLSVKDLVPVLSWFWLKGKCCYCHQPISTQYPIVEVATAILFVASYIFWPLPVAGDQVVIFALWLAILVGLISLLVYDLRWMLLPDKIVFSLLGLAIVQSFFIIFVSTQPRAAFINAGLGTAVGGGLFYAVFQISKGKWIGGGDVKLGFVLGLLAGTAGRAFLLIFLASLLGTLISLPMLWSKRLTKSSHIPFGPFLIVAMVIVQLFGYTVLQWYEHTFLGL